jgi:YD repeat-containing protein
MTNVVQMLILLIICFGLTQPYSSAWVQGYGYDLSGRLTNLESFDQTSTAFSCSADTRTTTETFPGGLTKVTTRYLDGRLKSILRDLCGPGVS